MALTLRESVNAEQTYLELLGADALRADSIYSIDDEWIYVRGVYSVPGHPTYRQLTVERAFLGTAAAAHTRNAALAVVTLGAGGAGGGGGSDVLTDPGNDWAPSTVVTVGYRIAETVDGELRVFEATNAGTTEAEATAFTDYTISLAPLGLTLGNVTWQYLGIVGELPWDIVPLPGIGLDDQGFHVDAFSTVGDAETMLQLLPALGDPGNAWESATLINTPNYRIASLISGSLRVFEAVTLGTTGGSEPTWQIALIGQTTTDGTASWSYRGIVGQPDTDRPVFVVNSAGDADWYFDQSNSSGFRFNQSVDGVPVSGAGRTEMTTDHFKAAIPGGGELTVQYDPFAIIVLGLPTADPVISGHLWNDTGTLKVSAG
jgi:hypothetical protein